MIKLPECLKQPMRLYREAGHALPTDFINFHAELADADLKAKTWRVIEDRGLVSDGWIDGFKVREVIIAIPDATEFNGYRIANLRWDDSGAWFEKKRGGGWARAFEAEPFVIDQITTEWATKAA